MLTLLIMWFSLATGYQNNSLIFNENDQSLSLRGYCAYFIDTTGLPIEEVVNKEFSKHLSDTVYQSDHPIWIRFTVNNTSSNRYFLLTVDQWDYADLYVANGQGNWILYPNGTKIPVTQRPESHHRLLSYLIFQYPSSESVYYLRVQNTDQLKKYYARLYDFVNKLEFETASYARKKYTSNAVLIAFVMGVCFVLVIYNLVLFINSRRWDHLILLFYIIAIGLFIANIHGITTNYIFSGVQSFEMHLGLILAHLIAILLALYVKNFLKLRGKEWMNLLIYMLIIFFSINLLVSLMEQRSFLYFPRRILESAVLVTILLGAFYQRRPGLLFLSLAILCSILGANISEFFATSVTNVFVRSDMPFLGGVIAQMLLFTIGSSQNVRQLETQVQQALQEKQQILAEQNVKLNRLVEERTNELNVANLAISERNEELTVALDELQKAQQQLIESEKMATIGTLVSGIAHEINNPLNVIGGMVGLLKRDLKEIQGLVAEGKEAEFSVLRTEMEELYGDILFSSVKVTTIINNLLEITPETDHQLVEKIDLKEMCESICFLFGLKHPHIKFSTQTPAQFTLIGNHEEIKQVLLNIIRNAVEAVEKTDNAQVELNGKMERGILGIEIRDNGVGIATNQISKIFDPFYTTKETGSGTGLGLFVVKSVVNKHKGNIAVQSGVNNQTVFTVTFPV